MKKQQEPGKKSGLQRSKDFLIWNWQEILFCSDLMRPIGLFVPTKRAKSLDGKAYEVFATDSVLNIIISMFVNMTELLVNQSRNLLSWNSFRSSVRSQLCDQESGFHRISSRPIRRIFESL